MSGSQRLLSNSSNEPGPAMGEHESGKACGVARADMERVDSKAIDRGDDLRDGVEAPARSFAIRSPRPSSRRARVGSAAAHPAPSPESRLLLGPPAVAQARSQVVEILFGHGNAATAVRHHSSVLSLAAWINCTWYRRATVRNARRLRHKVRQRQESTDDDHRKNRRGSSRVCAHGPAGLRSRPSTCSHQAAADGARDRRVP